MKLNTLLLGLCAWSLPLAAQAQDPLELGVIRNDDIHVVQKMMYPKTDRTEFGVHVGIMPFDAYLMTPNAQFSLNIHSSERLSISVVAGGGYGLKTGTYRELESPTYGVAAYAFRYLGSALGGIEYAPIYAKMNLNGAKVLHFDIYGAARGGLSIEQSVLPDAGMTLAPTLSPGIGSRIFVGKNTTVRVELRDDLLLERRSITQSTHLKQNANVLVGLTFLSKVPER
jgi:outer membrane beta-barrel protein